MLKGGKALFALAGLAAISISAAALAEEAPYATYDIRLESSAIQTKQPALATPVSKDTVAFRIENNTGKAAYFVNGAEKEYIPVVSNKTVVAPYNKDTYKIVDSEGNVLLSWKLASAGSKMTSVSSASKAQFAEWGNKIQQVLESSRNRTANLAYKSEPAVYYSRSTQEPKLHLPVKKHAIIRGYW